MALERQGTAGKVQPSFPELTTHLQRLGDLAWRSGVEAIKEACKLLDISYQESDIATICSELAGNTFETQAEPLEVPVCDFLAYILHATPCQQNFEKLNPSENATAIHRVDERGLFLHYYQALVRFIEGVSCNGCVWYDQQQRLPSIPLEEVNIYQVNHWIIEPLTSKEDFSYTEVVTVDSCAPKQMWFISHWWGEAMPTFVQCLAKHLDIRRMSADRTAYWTAWAGLGPGERSAEAELPTAQALAQRKVLLLLNAQGKAFQRTWCALEMAVATGLGEARKDPQKPNASHRVGLLDLVTLRNEAPGAGLPVVLTDGLTEVEQEWEAKHEGMGHIGKTDREKRFPLEVLNAGLALDLAETNTSVPSERTWVHNFLGKLVMMDQPATLQNVSDHLRSFFAGTALVQALKRQLSIAPYFSIIAANVAQQELKLPCLAHVLQDPETFLSELATALRQLSHLKALYLDLGWRSIYANGHISNLLSAAWLAPGLEHLVCLQDLTLRLSGCCTLRSFGCALALPRTLQRLELGLDGCERLEDATELLRGIGDLMQLTSLRLSMSGCKGLLVDSDLVLLGKSLRQLQELQHLSLNFSGTKRLFYLIELGRTIRYLRQLHEFHLDLSLCINLSDIAHLGNSVRILLEGPLRGSDEVPGSFSLKLDRSGVRINREKVVGYDSAGAFVKALGIRALSDPEDDVGPPVEKERPCVWLTHLQEMAIKRSFRVPLGCQGMHKGCPRLY